MDYRALRLIFLLIIAGCIQFLSGSTGVLAARNITVDDTDPAIIYSPPGSWNRYPDNATVGFLNDAFTSTYELRAVAMFNFTGVAIYFLYPSILNSHVSMNVSLDSATPISFPLSPSNPVSQGIPWYATGLENKQHTVLFLPGDGFQYAIVDALIYTDLSDNPLPVPSASPSTSPPTSSSATATQTNQVITSPASNLSAPTFSQRQVIAAALGSIFGILALLVILLAARHFWRQRQWPMTVDVNTSGEDRLTNSREDGSGEDGSFSKFLRSLGIARKRTEHHPGRDAGASSPTQPVSGRQIDQTPEGDKAAPRYGIVDPHPPIDIPSTSPPLTHGPQHQTSEHGPAYQDESGYYHPQPYSHRPPPPPSKPSNEPSTTTEGPTPQMHGSSRARTGVLPPILPESGLGSEPQ